MVEGAGDRLRDLVRAASGETDETRVNMLTVSLMASTLHPILLSGIPKRVFGFSALETKTREAYIELCIDRLRPR